jgi:membrane protein YdbS with pleckstrin-like domain
MPIVKKFIRFLPAPGGSTTQSWFGTKKAPYDRGRRFPGLFQTDGFHSQSIAFIVMLVLEIGALIVAGIFAKSNLLTAILVALVLFAGDLFSAWLLYRYHTTECEVENKKVKLDIAGGIGLTENIEVLEEEKQKSKIWNFYLGVSFLIALVGFKANLLAPYFKSGVKSMGGKNDITEIMIGLVVVYTLNAVIHLTCTGFVWAELITRWKYRKNEKDDTLRIQQGANGIQTRFSINNREQQLENYHIPNRDGSIAHRLYRVEDDRNGTPQYVIESWCIFEDAVLQEFANAQVNRGGAETANRLADQLFLHQCSMAGI